MKKLTSLFVASVFILTTPAFADDGSLLSTGTMNYVAYGVIVATLFVLLLAFYMVLRAFKKVLELAEKHELQNIKQIEVVPVTPAVKNSLINKLLSLRPMEEEHALVIEHEYDGIKELDNPTPAWFMGLFYATMVFAIGYMLVYHGFGIGKLQDEEYVVEMQLAEKQKEAWLAKAGNAIDENSVKVSTDAGVIAAGQTIFTQNCAPCHGDKGQGVVGPNLTDDYWLHGGGVKDVFKTIKYGVQAKGMPNWDKQLSPKQIADVANFIISIHGTNPAGAKAAEGEKYKAQKTAMLTH